MQPVKQYVIYIYFHTPDVSAINPHPQGDFNTKEIYNIIYVLYIYFVFMSYRK